MAEVAKKFFVGNCWTVKIKKKKKKKQLSMKKLTVSQNKKTITATIIW